MPGTVLGARGTVVNQTDTNVCAHEAHILVRGASIRQSFCLIFKVSAQGGFRAGAGHGWCWRHGQGSEPSLWKDGYKMSAEGHEGCGEENGLRIKQSWPSVPRRLGLSEDCLSLRLNNVRSSKQMFPCMKTVTALRTEPAQVPPSGAPLNVLVVRMKGTCTSPCTAALGGHLGGPGRPLVASLVCVGSPCVLGLGELPMLGSFLCPQPGPFSLTQPFLPPAQARTAVLSPVPV